MRHLHRLWYLFDKLFGVGYGASKGTLHAARGKGAELWIIGS
jgi:hypothetical protein